MTERKKFSGKKPKQGEDSRNKFSKDGGRKGSARDRSDSTNDRKDKRGDDSKGKTSFGKNNIQLKEVYNSKLATLTSNKMFGNLKK